MKIKIDYLYIFLLFLILMLLFSSNTFILYNAPGCCDAWYNTGIVSLGLDFIKAIGPTYQFERFYHFFPFYLITIFSSIKFSTLIFSFIKIFLYIIIFYYLISIYNKDKKIVFLYSIFFSIIPEIHLFNHTDYPNGTAALFFLISIYFLNKYIFDFKKLNFYLSSYFSFLSIFTFFTFIIPVLILYLVFFFLIFSLKINKKLDFGRSIFLLLLDFKSIYLNIILKSLIYVLIPIIIFGTIFFQEPFLFTYQLKQTIWTFRNKYLWATKDMNWIFNPTFIKMFFFSFIIFIYFQYKEIKKYFLELYTIILFLIFILLEIIGNNYVLQFREHHFFLEILFAICIFKNLTNLNIKLLFLLVANVFLLIFINFFFGLDYLYSLVAFFNSHILLFSLFFFFIFFLYRKSNFKDSIVLLFLLFHLIFFQINAYKYFPLKERIKFNKDNYSETTFLSKEIFSLALNKRVIFWYVNSDKKFNNYELQFINSVNSMFFWGYWDFVYDLYQIKTYNSEQKNDFLNKLKYQFRGLNKPTLVIIDNEDVKYDFFITLSNLGYEYNLQAVRIVKDSYKDLIIKIYN